MRSRFPYASDLNYIDALKVLGQHDHVAVGLADRLAGAAAAAFVASAGQLDAFSLRAEIIGWGRGASNRIGELVLGATGAPVASGFVRPRRSSSLPRSSSRLRRSPRRTES